MGPAQPGVQASPNPRDKATKPSRDAAGEFDRLPTPPTPLEELVKHETTAASAQLQGNPIRAMSPPDPLETVNPQPAVSPLANAEAPPRITANIPAVEKPVEYQSPTRAEEIAAKNRQAHFHAPLPADGVPSVVSPVEYQSPTHAEEIAAKNHQAHFHAPPPADVVPTVVSPVEYQSPSRAEELAAKNRQAHFPSTEYQPLESGVLAMSPPAPLPAEFQTAKAWDLTEGVSPGSARQPLSPEGGDGESASGAASVLRDTAPGVSASGAASGLQDTGSGERVEGTLGVSRLPRRLTSSGVVPSPRLPPSPFESAASETFPASSIPVPLVPAPDEMGLHAHPQGQNGDISGSASRPATIERGTPGGMTTGGDARIPYTAGAGLEGDDARKPYTTGAGHEDDVGAETANPAASPSVAMGAMAGSEAVGAGPGRDDNARLADSCGRLPTMEENREVAGPFLQYLGCDPSTGVWLGSVLTVVPPGCSQPGLRYWDGGSEKQLTSFKFDSMEGWTAWRFNLKLRMGPLERRIEYRLQCEGPQEANRQKQSLWIPGQGQTWRWGFHSCNGLSADGDATKWGVPHLWSDVLAQHREAPLHCLVGGGDQLYNDGVWQVPQVRAWLTQKTEERIAAPFTEEMRFAVSRWYFNHYRTHWMADGFRVALASIPQIMVWDDHDIFDGWGSYPDVLQNCPVFQGMYVCARRQYLLWQLHTTHERAREDNAVWGPPATYSQMRMLGPTVVLVLLDTRAERTIKQICSLGTYKEMFDRLYGLPDSVRHAVLITTVPVIFPSLPLSETVMKALDTLPLVKGAMQKTGLAEKIYDSFGHAQLLDDIVDHWDAGSHKHERKSLIKRLQHYSSEAEVRVSFLSGDVHCCGAGRVYSRPKVRHLQNDHRFMTQVVSSAIWNAPPPPVLINLLHRTNRASQILVKTKEKMLRLFKETHPGTDKLVAARNWCLVEERPPASPSDAADAAHRHHPHHMHSLFGRTPASPHPGPPPSPTAGGTPPTPVGGATTLSVSGDGTPTPVGGATPPPREGGTPPTPVGGDVDSPIASLRPPRSVFARPESSGLTPREAGSLNFVLRVENPDNQQAPPMCYSVIAPTMLHSASGRMPAVRRGDWLRHMH